MSEPRTAAGPQTDQGKWLIAHQGLVNIGKWDGSMRGDEIDLRACVVTIEAEARAAALDVDALVDAMNEAYQYADRDNAVPELPFIDDVEVFWEPFAAKVIDALRERDR